MFRLTALLLIDWRCETKYRYDLVSCSQIPQTWNYDLRLGHVVVYHVKSGKAVMDDVQSEC